MNFQKYFGFYFIIRADFSFCYCSALDFLYGIGYYFFIL